MPSKTDRLLTDVLPKAELALERPLYLGLNDSARLVLEDQDALRASSAGQTRRIPLIRLSRIVLGPHAQWSADVLRACLERGISVSFVDESGHAYGHAWGNRVRQLGRSALLQFAQEDPHWWTEHYPAWYGRVEQAQVSRALLGLGFDVRTRTVASARAALAAHYLNRHGEEPAPLFRAVDQLVETRVQSLLAASCWLVESDPATARTLTHDFRKLLAPALERSLGDHPAMRGRTRERARDLAWLAALIEHHDTTRHDFEVLSTLLESELRSRYG